MVCTGSTASSKFRYPRHMLLGKPAYLSSSSSPSDSEGSPWAFRSACSAWKEGRKRRLWTQVVRRRLVSWLLTATTSYFHDVYMKRLSRVTSKLVNAPIWLRGEGASPAGDGALRVPCCAADAENDAHPL